MINPTFEQGYGSAGIRVIKGYWAFDIAKEYTGSNIAAVRVAPTSSIDETGWTKLQTK